MTTEELEIWKRLNECECVKRVFGGWKRRDYYFSQDRKQIYSCEYGTMDGRDRWIPPLYDPIRPERSLWVIADKMNAWADLYSACNNGRPDLALAKEIIEQEEGK